MARMTFEELNAKLDACIEAGVIYNVDFKDWTSMRASRMLEADIDEVRAEFTHCGKFQDRTETEMNAIEALDYTIIRFPSKKLIKAVAAIDGPVAERINAVITKWEPVGDKFRTLKPMIQKGRKPAETPRKTEERTLENTGTCACCGKNVKLDGGKIVAHGYTIRRGFQEGSCPGVGYDPVEVSPEGIEAYLALLVQLRQSTVAALARAKQTREAVPGFRKMVEPDEAGYERARRNHIAQLEGDYRFFYKGVEQQQDRIDNWEAQPLPGELLKGAA